MDSLIASGTGAAIVYSLWLCAEGRFGHLYFDTAGMIVALIMLGKYLEGRSRRKASGAIRELMRLAPETAIRIEDGREREIPAAFVRKGDLLRVKPGAGFRSTARRSRARRRWMSRCSPASRCRSTRFPATR